MPVSQPDGHWHRDRDGGPPRRAHCHVTVDREPIWILPRPWSPDHCNNFKLDRGPGIVMIRGTARRRDADGPAGGPGPAPPVTGIMMTPVAAAAAAAGATPPELRLRVPVRVTGMIQLRLSEVLSSVMPWCGGQLELIMPAAA